RQGRGPRRPFRYRRGFSLHRHELPADRARALRDSARAASRPAAAQAVCRDPVRAREREGDQERRPRASFVEARQARGARSRDQATRRDDGRGPEGVPGRDPDPLGLRRAVRGERPEQGPLLAGQCADAVRRRCERADPGVQGVPGQRGEDLMAVALAHTDVWTERRRRVAELRSRQGFARQLLDFYGALLAVQERVFVEAVAAAPPPRAVVAYVAELVVPSIVDVSVGAGPDRLRAEVLQWLDRGEVHEILPGWMRGEAQPAVERYLARASLGPVLEALGQAARAECEGPRDTQHCPDCGGPPQLSFTTRAADDLATGPRHLLCARCGATWGYARASCPGCGEDSSASLMFFSEHGTTSGERGSVVRGLP